MIVKIIIIFNLKYKMSRRNISPVKPRTLIEAAALPQPLDEREQIIKKLKQDLIIARSKQKEVVILENYLLEVKEKSRMLSQDLKRKQNDIKSKTDLSQKAIADLKREVEIFKGQLKNKSVELGEKQATLLDMKRHLTKRASQIEKVKKDTLYLKEQNDRLMQQNANYMGRYEDIEAELIRIEAANRDYEARLGVINVKIGQVKSYIDQLNLQARNLKDKLKKHEQENNSISDDLNNKQENIDDLQRKFADQHDQIKNQIDIYIELEHRNEKILTETRHKLNLNKAENEKTVELNTIIQKVDKQIARVGRDHHAVQDQVKKYTQANNEYNRYNLQLTQDLSKCEAHLQNLMKYNAQIQEELQKYLREDEQIIAVLKRKRAVDMIPIRESRKLTTERTYV